jgi:hypothetical protein
MNSIFSVIKNWWKNPQAPEQGRKFGYGLGTALAFLAILAMYRGNPSKMETLALCSAVLWAFALVMPKLLYLPAWLIEETVKLVFKITMYLMLFAVFYFVFAPVGIMIRVLRKDPMDAKFDTGAETFWIKRVQRDPSHIEKQF